MDILVKNEADQSHTGDVASKLIVFHVTDSHFRSVPNHNNYRLLKRL